MCCHFMLHRFIITSIALLLTTFFITTVVIESALAAPNTIDIQSKDKKSTNDDLIVISNVNLQNIEKTGFLRVVGFINAQEFSKDIPLSNISNSTQKLSVKFIADRENEIVSAKSPDEFFVCAYHIEEMTEDYNHLPPYFDCDEGDLAGSDSTTISRLFGAQSLVYDKTAYHYLENPSHQESFATLDDGYTEDDRYNTREENTDTSDSNNDDNQPVKVKIIVPMQDKKNAEKIKIMTMLKGEIKYTVIDDVQKEFDKIGGYTIERTFDFDRNTDMGPIQIGDRFHACVIGEDLNPPEGSECEKKLIKHLDKPNSLAVR